MINQVNLGDRLKNGVGTYIVARHADKYLLVNLETGILWTDGESDYVAFIKKINLDNFVKK